MHTKITLETFLNVCGQYCKVSKSPEADCFKKGKTLHMFHSIMSLRILLGDNNTAHEKLPWGVKMPWKTHWECTVDNRQQLGLQRMRLSGKKKKSQKGYNCVIPFI